MASVISTKPDCTSCKKQCFVPKSEAESRLLDQVVEALTVAQSHAEFNMDKPTSQIVKEAIIALNKAKDVSFKMQRRFEEDLRKLRRSAESVAKASQTGEMKQEDEDDFLAAEDDLEHRIKACQKKCQSLARHIQELEIQQKKFFMGEIFKVDTDSAVKSTEDTFNELSPITSNGSTGSANLLKSPRLQFKEDLEKVKLDLKECI